MSLLTCDGTEWGLFPVPVCRRSLSRTHTTECLWMPLSRGACHGVPSPRQTQWTWIHPRAQRNPQHLGPKTMRCAESLRERA